MTWPNGRIATPEDIAVATLLAEVKTLIEDTGSQLINSGVPRTRWIALEGFLRGTADVVHTMISPESVVPHRKTDGAQQD